MSSQEISPEVSREIPIPDEFRKKLYAILRGAQRVKLQFEPSTGRWKDIVSYDLSAEPGEMPREDADTITQTLVNDMDEDWREKVSGSEDEDPGERKYRVMIIAHKRNADGSASTERPSFQYAYTGDPDHSDESFARTTADTTIMDMLQQSMQLQKEHSEVLFRTIDKLSMHNDRLHQHIKDISKENHSLTQPMLKMYEMMGSVYIAGAEMRDKAMEMLYNDRRVQEQEAAANERWKMLIGTMGPQVMQALGIMMKIAKRHLDRSAQPDDNDEAPPRPRPRPRVVPDPPTEPSAPPPAPAEVHVEPPSAPPPPSEAEEEAEIPSLVDAVRIVAQTIMPSQWGAAAKLFGDRHYALITRLFEAESDQQVLAAWADVDKRIPKSELMRFASELSDEQRQWFMGLSVAITQADQAKNGKADSPTDEPAKKKRTRRKAE